MEVGVKLTCKESLMLLIIGKEYEIIDIIREPSFYNVVNNIPLDTPISYVIIMMNNTIKLKLSVDENSDMYIWNYFYTPTEMRLKKLKTIL